MRSTFSQPFKKLQSFSSSLSFSNQTFSWPRLSSMLGLVALILLGIAGNYFSLQLFFGVIFIFGSVATLLSIALYGPLWGAIAGVLIGSYTYVLWHHPYAAIVLAGEAVFIGATWKRFRHNLIIAAAIYWLLLGIPLSLFFYSGPLRMNEAESLLIALKQGVSGILNAIIASLVLAHTRLSRLLSLSPAQNQNSVFQTIFSFFVAAAVIPVFLFVIVDARDVVEDVEDGIQVRLDMVSSGIASSMRGWRQQYVGSVSLLADMVKTRGFESPESLQQLLDEVKNVSPHFQAMYIANADGIAVASYPKNNLQGQPIRGRDFSDRPYFQELKNGRLEPNVTSVLMGRSGAGGATVTINAPIIIDGKFVGIVSGALDLNHLSDMLKAIGNESKYRIVVLDQKGQVVASNSDTFTTSHISRDLVFQGASAEQLRDRRIESWSDGFFHRWPADTNQAPMTQPMTQWKDSLLGKVTQLDGAGDWSILVEIPLAPQQAELYSIYIRSMALLLGLVLVILAGSYWISIRFAKPLVQLSHETTNLPDKLKSGASIVWPQASFAEFNILVENFKTMLAALRRRFLELDQQKQAVELVSQVGLTLQSALDIEKIVETVTDTATRLTNASFGAFFYNVIDKEGQSYTLYSLSSDARSKFQKLSAPRKTRRFTPTFHGERLVRFDDILSRPDYEHNLPYHGLLEGAPLVRSYLAAPVVSRSGEVLGGMFFGHPDVGVFTENTERLVAGLAAQAAVAIDNARLYEQSQAISRAKDEFLAMLSHELRTPLNVVLGHAEILKAEAEVNVLGPEFALSIDAIQRNAKAQNQLIADLLDISAIITGKMTFQRTYLSLVDTIRSAMESVRIAAEAKGVQVRLELEDETCRILGDPTRLQQVIWNLLSNAVKFTPAGGEVIVSVRKEDGFCLIQVRDTGQGIEPDFLPHVFERFRQEDSSMTRRFGGLGLGLSIVRQLVELHGGTIQAASDGKGKGSRFTVRLPVAPLQAEGLGATTAGASTRIGAKIDLSGIKVLVIDDEPDARALFQRVLERGHAQVKTSPSSAEGLADYREFSPDIIVSDISMPNEDGYEFIRKLREIEKRDGAYTPVIALTANAREEDKRRALAAGYQAHLAKPISGGELLNAIASLASWTDRKRESLNPAIE